MLKRMLQERRAMPRKQQSDFFDYVLEELKKDGTILTEEIALDLMFVLLFASFETTSLALTLAIKFLSDHPLVLKQLTVSEVLEYYCFHNLSLFPTTTNNAFYMFLPSDRKSTRQFLTIGKMLILDLHGKNTNQ